jgi:long-chain acyl-CoA synthetase
MAAERRPWLRHYDAGVPPSLAPYPDRTLLDCISETASLRPDHPAVLFKGSRISYAELERLSDACASALIRLGVRKGDRVALIAPNCPQFIIAELGVWKAGAVLFPLNPLYTGHELVQPLAASGAETAIVLTPSYHRIKQCQADTSIKRVIATSIKEYLPPVLRLLFSMFTERTGEHQVVLEKGDLWLQEVISHNPDSPPAASRPGPEDPAVLLMSGGTTGTPKIAVGLHRCLFAAGLQLHAWLSPGSSDWDDVILMPLPLFHVYGGVGGQAYAFVGHNPLALVPNPRDLNDVLKTIEEVRPAFIAGVPNLFAALLNHPKVRRRKVDFSSVKICFSGAAPLLADTKTRFEDMTRGHIVEGYSLTEAMMACAANPLRDAGQPGSVGLPLPDVEVAVVDSDAGEHFLQAGEAGEVILRAPQLMTEYWGSPGDTAEALRHHGEGAAWLHTGDLGYLTADGYLFVIDRKKDLIKTRSYQVWPREVEEVIATHPAVAEVGVAGVLDSSKGEAVKAWIVCRPGLSVTPGELRAYCRERLAPFKVPAQIEIRTELPKTMTGKVLRRVLAAEGGRRPPG